MKVLVFGTGSSQFVKETIENVLLEENNEIYVIYDKDKSDLFLDFYKKNNINIINISDKSDIIAHIPKVRLLHNVKKAVKKATQDGKFDVIHLHGLNNYIIALFILFVLCKYTNRIICTFYGSDLLLRSKKELKSFEIFFRKTHSFSVASDNLKSKIHEAFGGKYDYKTYKIPFGLSNLSAIDEVNSSYECKKKFKIQPDRIVISIGHNSCPEQQHLQVIEEIIKLPTNIKKHVCILLQLTYGNGTKAYIDSIKAKINESGCECRILEKYMNGNEIANMVSAVDVYINAQKTDALSGAMIEYLYGETIVMIPKWLNYDELEAIGCEFIRFGDFSDLTEKLKDILIQKLTVNKDKNHDLIAELFHWRNQSSKWKNFIYGEK